MIYVINTTNQYIRMLIIEPLAFTFTEMLENEEKRKMIFMYHFYVQRKIIDNQMHPGTFSL